MKTTKVKCQNYYFEQKNGEGEISYPSKDYQNVVSTEFRKSTSRKDSQRHKDKRSAHHGRINSYDHGRSGWRVDIVGYVVDCTWWRARHGVSVTKKTDKRMNGDVETGFLLGAEHWALKVLPF